LSQFFTSKLEKRTSSHIGSTRNAGHSRLATSAGASGSQSMVSSQNARPKKKQRLHAATVTFYFFKFFYFRI